MGRRALTRVCGAQTEELLRRLAAAESARDAERARAEAAEAAAGKEREVAPLAFAAASLSGCCCCSCSPQAGDGPVDPAGHGLV